MPRLPDVVELVTRKYRETANVIRNPFTVFRREALKRGRSIYLNTTLPDGKAHTQTQAPSSPTSEPVTGSDSSDKEVRSGSSPSPPPVPSFLSRLRGKARSSSSTPSVSGPSSGSNSPVSSSGSSVPLWDDMPDRYDYGLFKDDLGDVDAFEEDDNDIHYRPTITLLHPGESLHGLQQDYTISSVMENRRTGAGVWYKATDRVENSVIIQEYWLRSWSFADPKEDISKRQTAFLNLVSANLNHLKGPNGNRDFRIVPVSEAFTHSVPEQDEHYSGRFYLVIPSFPERSLRDYMFQGPQPFLSGHEIREILRQLLQTLQFLHTACPIIFNDGAEDKAIHSDRLALGIPHGNLTLDSIFIQHESVPGAERDRQFFVHVADLALWHHLFQPQPVAGEILTEPQGSTLRSYRPIAQSEADLGTTADDLKALGRIGFELAGWPIDPSTNQLVDPHHPTLKQQLGDAPLHRYLCALQDGKTFPSADAAAKSLRALPGADQKDPSDIDTALNPLVASQDGVDDRIRRWGFPLTVVALLALVAIAIPFCRPASNVPDVVVKDELSDEEKAERYLAYTPVAQKIRYWTEDDGAWFTVFQRGLEGDRSLPSPPSAVPRTPNPLLDEIESRSSLEWHTDQTSPSFATRQHILWTLQDDPEHVGFMRWADDLDSANVTTHTIAHEGIAILVPLTDGYRPEGNVPGFFEGKITLADLRYLYTQPYLDNIYFKDQKVDLYFPRQFARGTEETVAIFQEKVLNNDLELIQKFDDLRDQAFKRDQKVIRDATGESLNDNLYELMLYQYEKKESISIGFDRFSNAFGQCSVYPLEVGTKATNTQSPLKQINNGEITPNVDLCDIKGSYFTVLADDYPLRYDLVLVHRKNSLPGKQLAQALLTWEAQYLMGEMGLTPIQDRQTIHNFAWSHEQ